MSDPMELAEAVRIVREQVIPWRTYTRRKALETVLAALEAAGAWQADRAAVCEDRERLNAKLQEWTDWEAMLHTTLERAVGGRGTCDSLVDTLIRQLAEARARIEYLDKMVDASVVANAKATALRVKAERERDEARGERDAAGEILCHLTPPKDHDRRVVECAQDAAEALAAEREQGSELRQAVGMLAALAPEMPLDPGHPLKMAQEILRVVTAERERSERLREAVGKIAAMGVDGTQPFFGFHDAVQIARAALAPAQPEELPTSQPARAIEVCKRAAQPECRHGGRQQGETPCPDCRSEEEKP